MPIKLDETSFQDGASCNTSRIMRKHKQKREASSVKVKRKRSFEATPAPLCPPRDAVKSVSPRSPFPKIKIRRNTFRKKNDEQEQALGCLALLRQVEESDTDTDEEVIVQTSNICQQALFRALGIGNSTRQRLSH